jgi:hypothetical protein
MVKKSIKDMKHVKTFESFLNESAITPELQDLATELIGIGKDENWSMSMFTKWIKSNDTAEMMEDMADGKDLDWNPGIRKQIIEFALQNYK